MKFLSASVARVWAHKLLWLGETLLLGVTGAAVYGWLALPVATVWHLVAHLLLAGAILALLYFGLRLASRSLGPANWKRAARAPQFWIFALACVAAGVWLPFRLIWWIPVFDALAAQAASAALRFTMAAALCTGALLCLLAAVRGIPGE
jgi:hypothetical protein